MGKVFVGVFLEVLSVLFSPTFATSTDTGDNTMSYRCLKLKSRCLKTSYNIKTREQRLNISKKINSPT